MSALGLPPAVWGAPPDHQEESGNRLLPGLQGFRQQGKEYIKHALSIVPLRFRLHSEEKNGKMIVLIPLKAFQEMDMTVKNIYDYSSKC